MNAKMAVFATILLAACSQSDAPSDKVEQAAHEVVSAVEGDPAQPAAGPYAPRNDCAELPEAAGFMQALNRAIAARDVEALVVLAADDIKLGSGEGGGTAELRQRLDDEDGALWKELDSLVELGCARNSQGGITLPWFFEQPIPGDRAKGFVVTGVDVPLYDAPAKDAPVLARLSWDAVEPWSGGPEERAPEQEGFQHVIVPENGIEPGEVRPPTGYVTRDRLRSMIGYRLTAASRNGRWRIISLLSGS